MTIDWTKFYRKLAVTHTASFLSLHTTKEGQISIQLDSRVILGVAQRLKTFSIILLINWLPNKARKLVCSTILLIDSQLMKINFHLYWIYLVFDLIRWEKLEKKKTEENKTNNNNKKYRRLNIQLILFNICRLWHFLSIISNFAWGKGYGSTKCRILESGSKRKCYQKSW